MNWDSYLFNRLLLAIPIFQLDPDFISFGRRTGILSEQEAIAYVAMAKKMKAAGHAVHVGKALRGKNLLQALLILEPEILSVTTIDFLRRANLITVTEGHAFRAALQARKLIVPAIVSDATLAARFSALLGATASNEMINLIRNLDDMRIAEIRNALLGTGVRLESEDAAYVRSLLIASIRRAQSMRSALSIARAGAATWKDLARINSVWDAATIVGEFLLSDRLLKDAIRVGIIPPERYIIIRALSDLGLGAWKRGVTAFSHESWAARALMLSEGILSTEMIRVLQLSGVISPDLARLLFPAAEAIRGITRAAASQYMASRKFRPVHGESAIKTFARSTNATDKAILKLLAEASRDAERDITRLMNKKGFGAKTRIAQQRLIRDSINKSMRALWEQVGYLTIFGEREAARAAAESITFMQGNLFKKTSKDIERMLIAQSRAGIDSLVSRSENTLPLSRLVYKNMGLTRGRVEREIQKMLIRGLGSRDLARVAAQFINPSVRGGVSYAAMRLARTEINNAFHFTQIRYTREMPWVRGYKWNLSGSHPALDICNEMATRDHDNLGRGVYKKANVPGKPHPQCLCFLTTVTDSAGVFEKGMRTGKYDRYLQSTDKDGAYKDAYHRDLRSALSTAAVSAAKIGGKVIVAKGLVGATNAISAEARTSLPVPAGV